MISVKAFLSGKKANMSAGWMFAGAVYLLMNGAQVTEAGDIVLSGGSGEMAALMTSFSVALATLRASIAKIAAGLSSNVPLILGTLALGVYMVGCASLGNTNPATGNTFGGDIQGEILNLSPLFGPVLSTVIPLATGSLLNIATIIGQMLEGNTTPPTTTAPVS